jgi:arginyl-tRNA synthetase
MQVLFDEIRLNLARALADALTKSFALNIPEADLYNALVPPPDTKMGHLAFPCFSLSKTLKKAPPQIAGIIKENLPPCSFITSAAVAGPYLNFFISTAEAGEKVIAAMLDGSYFKRKLTDKPPRTMIEYSQPNTHKELHVGHMRNLCLGHALVKLHKYAGYDVLSATFPGDLGTHVAKCLWYLKYHNSEKVPAEHKGAWLGRMYSLANNLLEDEEKTDKGPANKAQLTEILKQLEAKKGEFFDLWKETKQWSIDLMKEVYAWAGVDFDRWYFESEMDTPSLKYVRECFKKGLLVESDGAIGMDLSIDDLGFCLLIKTDGNGLYSTKDIELARRKFEEEKIEHNIYVVDKRQEFHFKQVFKVLERLGFPHAKECFHLKYDYVELPEGAMSSRKGNIVPLTDLVLNMEEMIKREFLHRYENEWTKEEINKTASMVAKGAISYGMLRIDNNRKIVFDMKEWLKLDGESGPYLQYVHARISSLCEKQNYVHGKVDWSLLTHPLEAQLLIHLTHFNKIALEACEQYKTAHLCAYLYELGKYFNSFYMECPIGKAPDEELKIARLSLAKATGLIMKCGLELLAIPAPQKM